MQRIIPRELGPKSVSENVPGANSIFFVAGILLFFLVAIASVLVFFLARFESTKQEGIRAEIKQKIDELHASETVLQAVDLEARLASLRGVLDGHVFSSNAIRLAEDDVHPQVRFGGFSFSADKRTVTAAATGKGFLAVAQQIDILKKDPRIERVGFGGLSMNEKGEVAFSLLITFVPALARAIPEAGAEGSLSPSSGPSDGTESPRDTSTE